MSKSSLGPDSLAIVPAMSLDVEDCPPLESGQRLSSDEFMRRYEAMPEVENAELIDGVVHLASPVSTGFHGEPHATLNGWLFTYYVRTPGLHLSDNSTTLLDARQVPQPDCILFINSEFGGRCQMNAQGYVLGPPELAVEISASTESYDLGAKFRAYERNGIREYLVWRVLDATIDWYELQGASYVPLAPDADGTMRSRVFPGLWLDVAALLRGDLLTVVETLGRGLESAEHAGFVRELRKSEGK